MAWTETASFPATRSLQGQPDVAWPAKLRGSSRELHSPCFGQRRGWDAKPLPTRGNRAGIPATGAGGIPPVCKGTTAASAGNRCCPGRGWGDRCSHTTVTVLKDLTYQGNQRCCPPQKHLSLGRERLPAPLSLPKLLQAQQTLKNCFCQGSQTDNKWLFCSR